jgi:hypothetical protein
MRIVPKLGICACLCGFFLSACCSPASAQSLSLQSLVTPSTVISKDGHTVTFAVHGFVEFHSLAELFPYIGAQAQRWKPRPGFDESAIKELRRDLLRRGIESRVVSMIDGRPLEALITHTRMELQNALAQVKEPVPDGYADTFLAMQEKWKHSMNCWSASSSIPGRVLSNWYPIEEGIQLYGATYDSSEHFWQAVKYHPQTSVKDLLTLLSAFEERDWKPWIAYFDADPNLYLPNAYAVEFLRHNLAHERLEWFRGEIDRQGVHADEFARSAQQRGSRPFRFSAYEEKVLWGDLADVFHLVYIFSPSDDPMRKTLAERHFDGIYLGERKLDYISEEFRSLMLEIWKIKYLQMARFGEVIRSIPTEIRLSHFLNDGDSPDIPIPVYVKYLNEIREMARSAAATH